MDLISWTVSERPVVCRAPQSHRGGRRRAASPKRARVEREAKGWRGLGVDAAASHSLEPHGNNERFPGGCASQEIEVRRQIPLRPKVPRLPHLPCLTDVQYPTAARCEYSLG